MYPSNLSGDEWKILVFSPLNTIKIATLALLLLKMPFVWAWPPTEEEKEKWKRIIQGGSRDELQVYVDELRSRGEDISQWFLIDTEDKDSKYHSLVRAAEVGEPESVQQLIENGAELQRYVEKSNTSQMTPLVAACQWGHTSVVDKLLAAGADVNARAWLSIPVNSVARAFQIVSVRRVIDAGDSPEKLGVWGWPGSSDYSLEEDLSLFASLFVLPKIEREKGPEYWSIAFRHSLLSKLQKSETIKKIAKNEQMLMQDFPVNVAAVYGHTDIVAELVKRGADTTKVNALGRATLQQIYPANKGLTESFLQFHSPTYWSSFAPELQKRLSLLIPTLGCKKPELQEQINQLIPALRSKKPLINQGVFVTTLDIPAHINLVDIFGRKVTRIEKFMLATDLIQVGDNKERVKNMSHIILLTGEDPNIRTPWIELGTPDNETNMFRLMELAVPLGAKVDEVGFYEGAHRELMQNDYKRESQGYPYSRRKNAQRSFAYSRGHGHGAHIYKWNGKSGFITTTPAEEFARICAEADKGDSSWIEKAGEVTCSIPLKQYWGSQKVPTEPVVVENTAKLTLNFRRWDQQPFPYGIAIRDYIMEQLLDWHRPQMARLIHAALEDHPELKKKAQEKGINLFCLGCGGGEDVRVFHKSMRDQGYDVHVTGIERLPLLCWNASRECHSIEDTTNFLCADAHNSAELIRQNRKKREGITIVVAEDFLVQQVLPGPYSGLKILHQLIQPDIADMVVVGGVHHPLMSERIAKNAGWSVQEIPIYHSDAVTPYLVRPELNGGNAVSTPAFVLTRPEQDSKWPWLKLRALRRSTKIITDEGEFSGTQSMKTLDLSMGGLPNDGLELALKQGNNIVTQIDLSYTYLEEGQLDKTINLLLAFPMLIHVMVSGFEPWYEAFLKAVKTTGRFKLVLRKDNQYRHELPTLDPDTAKLLSQFKTIPNERVFAPSRQAIHSEVRNAPAWTTDIDSGFLTLELLSVYQQQLLEILTKHNIQLQETPNDGLCFFHAIAQQLHIHEGDLRAALYNHVIANNEEIQAQFPQFAGQAFIELLSELSQGAWGDAGQAQLTAWVFNRRVILLYFNSQTGGVLIQLLNPDGTVTQPGTLPNDISQSDIILIHNGEGHWLAGSNTQSGSDLYQSNAHLLLTHNLPPLEYSLQKILAELKQRYSPEIFPKLIALLITAWQLKFQ